MVVLQALMMVGLQAPRALLRSPRRPVPAGTLTQNDMVVSKLWLAGHLLPDLKPWTRRRHGGSSSSSSSSKPLSTSGGGGAGGSASSSGSGDGARSWERPRAGSKGGKGAAAAPPPSPDLPPLVAVLTSAASVTSLGSTSAASLDCPEGGGSGGSGGARSSRSSMLDSLTAGSTAPADIVQARSTRTRRGWMARCVPRAKERAGGGALAPRVAERRGPGPHPVG